MGSPRASRRHSRHTSYLGSQSGPRYLRADFKRFSHLAGCDGFISSRTTTPTLSGNPPPTNSPAGLGAMASMLRHRTSRLTPTPTGSTCSTSGTANDEARAVHHASACHLRQPRVQGVASNRPRCPDAAASQAQRPATMAPSRSVPERRLNTVIAAKARMQSARQAAENRPYKRHPQRPPRARNRPT